MEKGIGDAVTERELNELYYIEKEIEAIALALEELPADAGLGNRIFDGMPRGTDIGDKTAAIALKRAGLKNRLQQAEERRIEAISKIHRYIDGVQDAELRSIMIMRFIELKSWDEIGDKLHYNRTPAVRTLHKYLNKKAE